MCTGSCAPSQTECQGNTAYSCSNGTWANPTNCSTNNTTCVNGVCSGQCAPGQTNCSGSTPQTCSSTGTWTNQATCMQPNPDCSGGSCTCLETMCSGQCVNTQTNTGDCGGCGNVCSVSHESAVTCTGGTCSYTCAAGYADCNTANHNLGGCACPSASASTQGTVGGCCGSGCQTQHKNGVGAYYYDCVALSTYNQTQATEAATSDTAQAGTIFLGQCGTAPDVQYAVFKSVDTTGNTGTCTGWVYAGSGTYQGVNLAQTVGTTYASSGNCGAGDCGCYCSLLTTPNWN
jgi:hypothetical protein